MVFALKVDEFTCCVLCHSSRFKQSVPRFPLYTLFSFDLKERERRRWDLILTSCKINSLLFVVQEINPPLKNPPGKTSDFLHKLYLGNEADLSKTYIYNVQDFVNLYKSSYKIWSVFDKVHFKSKILNALFPPSFLFLFIFNIIRGTGEVLPPITFVRTYTVDL